MRDTMMRKAEQFTVSANHDTMAMMINSQMGKKLIKSAKPHAKQLETRFTNPDVMLFIIPPLA